MFAPGGDFVNDNAMGACAPLDEYLAECPGLTDLIPDVYFDACRIGGVLYGIPAYKDCSMTNYFVWTKSIVEEFYPEYTEAHTLAEIYDGLAACVEGAPGEIGLALASNGFPAVTGQKYDSAGLPDVGMGIAYEGGTEFVAVWEQADIKADLEVLAKMYAEGLINSDAPVLDTFEGMCILGVAQGWPSAAKGWGEGRGCEVVVSQYEDTVVSTDTVRGSVLTINANSAHKVEAMKLIELVNTDTQLRDWLWYGEEGVNYEYVEEDGVKKVSKINTDWTMAAYTQGTFFIATPEVGSNGYREIMALNESATVSPAMGFAPDTSAIADTLANLAAIRANYSSMFSTGADISMVAPMMEEMRANGFDECLAEINAQYQAWLANQ
jgi:putative aldouronate transport system substrate-binding protein